MNSVQDQILTGLSTTTHFSSCHTSIPYTDNNLHIVSSYYFQSYMKLFHADNFDVSIRPDLLYFSVWRICQKDAYNVTYGRSK